MRDKEEAEEEEEKRDEDDKILNRDTRRRTLRVFSFFVFYL